MRTEIVVFVVFTLLFLMFGTMYFFGDKILLSMKKSKPQKKKEIKPEVSPDKKEQEQPKTKKTGKIARPILLSPTPVVKDPEPEKPKDPPKRTISKDEIAEIKRFIEEKPIYVNEREGLSDYNKIEEFGNVIDLDSIDTTPSYDPYVKRSKSSESEFLKNRGDEKNLYEELKNMSPEMKKIIMADILKRRSD